MRTEITSYYYTHRPEELRIKVIALVGFKEPKESYIHFENQDEKTAYLSALTDSGYHNLLSRQSRA